MPLLYGFFGATLALLLFALFFYLGWHVRSRFHAVLTSAHPPTTADPAGASPPELSEEELEQVQKLRKQLLDEQAAFNALVNYNMDTAYGLGASPIEGKKGE